MKEINWDQKCLFPSFLPPVISFRFLVYQREKNKTIIFVWLFCREKVGEINIKIDFLKNIFFTQVQKIPNLTYQI